MLRTKPITEGIVKALSSDEEHDLAWTYEVEVIMSFMACPGGLHGHRVFD